MSGQVGDIQSDDFCLNPLLFQFCHRSLALFMITHAENQVNAQTSKFMSSLQSQPAIAARYQCHFICVRFHVCTMA